MLLLTLCILFIRLFCRLPELVEVGKRLDMLLSQLRLNILKQHIIVDAIRMR